MHCNHDFCHFIIDFKEFFVGAGWNAKIQCLSPAKSLYTLIANRLNLKYKTLCCDGRVVNASDQGHRWHPVRVSPDPSYKLSIPGY